MTIIQEIKATEERFRQREKDRRSNLAKIARGDIFQIAANTPENVRRRISRLHADPDHVLPLQAKGLAFEARGPGRSPDRFPRSLERVLHTNDLMGLRFLEQGLRVANAVGRVHIRDERGQSQGYGTGFLVSPRLLLTNHHVLATASQAKRSLVEFNYQESANAEMKPSRVFALAPSELFLSNEDLDYALVAVAADPELRAYGWLPLIEEQGKLLVGETVNIIQHPNGEPKQLAIRNNQVVDELELFLHYQTDTSPGSSGSPVFNDQWEVVALHHSGVPKRNAAGAVVTVDGREWQEWMGEQRIAWEANEGVRVSRLVQHIRQQSLPAEAETLRQELLRSTAAAPPPVAAQPSAEQAPAAAQPAPAAPQPPPAPAPAPPVAPTTPAVASAPLPAGGATSWTIPLQLQVSLTVGSPTVTLAAEPPGPAASLSESELWNPWAKKPATPPPPPPPPTTGGADFRIDSLLQESFDWHTALSLGLASELAYSPAAAVRSQALAWGFQDCSFVEARAAQGFVASSAEVVLVSFRGTESTADWLSNLQVRPQTVAGLGRAHAGFWGQFTALQAQLESRLAMRQGVPLVVTGHSLGGAIAVLAAITWAASHSLRALYTYGQPAVAQGEAVTAISTALAGRYHRLVNDADIVPRVPPGYRHTGQLLHFNNEGKVTSPAAPREASASRPLESAPLESASPAQEAPMLAESEFLMLQERLHRQSGAPGQEGATDLISDHMIPRYLEQIRRQPL
jgi:V8-like Glu-specific endopeptidase